MAGKEVLGNTLIWEGPARPAKSVCTFFLPLTVPPGVSGLS